MKLAVFNGSPRKAKSNSTLLINHFLNGYHDNISHNHSIHYLASDIESGKHVAAFVEADTVIIIFPLYTDAMPAQVKYFFEQIVELNTTGKNVGFIVQSGFPEAYHSIFIEKYLQRLSSKMGWNYLGTVIKGGIEGIQIMPDSMTRKLYNNFHDLGKYFSVYQQFDPSIVAKLQKKYRLTTMGRLGMRIVIATGLNDFYWNNKLKEYHAYSQRFDKPYA